MHAFDSADVIVRLLIAGLGGLAVGIEREWSTKVATRRPRFAGVRTFLLLGLIGGLSADLHLRGHTAIGGTILVAACLLVVVAYAAAAFRGDIDGTTEVAALIVLAAGTLAGSGRLQLASGICALTALALVEKTRIHAVVYRMQPETLEAAARFAVLALVVLPLLPEGPLGPPPGIRPRELWTLVLVFSGVSFAGFLALAAAGPRRGYGLAGVFGGLISSTAVTLMFARESRDRQAGGGLALGIIAASTVLLVRVTVLAFILDPTVALAAVPLFWLPFVAGAVACAAALRWTRQDSTEVAMGRNPLRLVAALEMTLAFQSVLYAVHWASTRFGDPGTLASAALVGLVDMDALTYSIVKLGGEATHAAVAARALSVGVLANTLIKLAFVIAIARGVTRRAAATGLAVLAIATAAALLLW